MKLCLNQHFAIIVVQRAQTSVYARGLVRIRAGTRSSHPLPRRRRDSWKRSKHRPLCTLAKLSSCNYAKTSKTDHDRYVATNDPAKRSTEDPARARCTPADWFNIVTSDKGKFACHETQHSAVHATYPDGSVHLALDRNSYINLIFITT